MLSAFITGLVVGIVLSIIVIVIIASGKNGSND